MDICIVDFGCDLVAFASMDGARLGSVDITFNDIVAAAGANAVK